MQRAGFWVLLFLAVSCSPKITVNLIESLPPVEWRNSGILDVDDSIPSNAHIVGSFVAESNNSNYRLMYYNISKRAHGIGSNVIKLDSVYSAPFEGFSGKSELSGYMLYIDNTDSLSFIWSSAKGLTGTNSMGTIPSPYKFEFNLGSAGEPLYAMDVFPFGVMDIAYEGTSSLEELNSRCFDVLVTPALSAEFVFHINANIALVSYLGCSQAKVTYFDPFSELPTGKESLYMFDFIAGARVSYLRNDYMCCYSQALFGITTHTPGDYWRYNEYADKRFGWQVTALGFSFGKRLFGTVEFGWGSEYCAIGLVTGSRFGIGYRF